MLLLTTGALVLTNFSPAIYSTEVGETLSTEDVILADSGFPELGDTSEEPEENEDVEDSGKLEEETDSDLEQTFPTDGEDFVGDENDNVTSPTEPESSDDENVETDTSDSEMDGDDSKEENENLDLSDGVLVNNGKEFVEAFNNSKVSEIRFQGDINFEKNSTLMPRKKSITIIGIGEEASLDLGANYLELGEVDSTDSKQVFELINVSNLKGTNKDGIVYSESGKKDNSKNWKMIFEDIRTYQQDSDPVNITPTLTKMATGDNSEIVVRGTMAINTSLENFVSRNLTFGKGVYTGLARNEDTVELLDGATMVVEPGAVVNLSSTGLGKKSVYGLGKATINISGKSTLNVFSTEKGIYLAGDTSTITVDSESTLYIESGSSGIEFSGLGSTLIIGRENVLSDNSELVIKSKIYGVHFSHALSESDLKSRMEIGNGVNVSIDTGKVGSGITFADSNAILKMGIESRIEIKNTGTYGIHFLYGNSDLIVGENSELKVYAGGTGIEFAGLGSFTLEKEGQLTVESGGTGIHFAGLGSFTLEEQGQSTVKSGGTGIHFAGVASFTLEKEGQLTVDSGGTGIHFAGVASFTIEEQGQSTVKSVGTGIHFAGLTSESRLVIEREGQLAVESGGISIHYAGYGSMNVKSNSSLNVKTTGNYPALEIIDTEVIFEEGSILLAETSSYSFPAINLLTLLSGKQKSTFKMITPKFFDIKNYYKNAFSLTNTAVKVAGNSEFLIENTKINLWNRRTPGNPNYDVLADEIYPKESEYLEFISILPNKKIEIKEKDKKSEEIGESNKYGRISGEGQSLFKANPLIEFQSIYDAKQEIKARVKIGDNWLGQTSQPVYAEAGEEVTFTDTHGEAGSAVTDEDGYVSFVPKESPVFQTAKGKVTARFTYNGKTYSSDSSSVLDVTPPEPAKIAGVTETGDGKITLPHATKSISGTAEKGSDVYLIVNLDQALANNKKIEASNIYKLLDIKDENWTIEIPKERPLVKGDTFRVFLRDSSKDWNGISEELKKIIPTFDFNEFGNFNPLETMTLESVIPQLEGFNREFKAATKVTIVEGAVSLTVPSHLSFGNATITTKEQTILPSLQEGESLTVTDGRAEGSSPWTLLLKESKPLTLEDQSSIPTGKPAHTLAGTLYYGTKLITDTEQKVATKSGTMILSDDWGMDESGKPKGIYLRVPVSKQLIGDYKGTLEWTLSDVVANTVE